MATVPVDELRVAVLGRPDGFDLLPGARPGIALEVSRLPRTSPASGPTSSTCWTRLRSEVVAAVAAETSIVVDLSRDEHVRLGRVELAEHVWPTEFSWAVSSCASSPPGILLLPRRRPRSRLRSTPSGSFRSQRSPDPVSRPRAEALPAHSPPRRLDDPLCRAVHARRWARACSRRGLRPPRAVARVAACRCPVRAGRCRVSRSL